MLDVICDEFPEAWALIADAAYNVMRRYKELNKAK